MIASALLAAALGTAGCARGGDPMPEIALDGSARFPDDEGILTEATGAEITLDGERTYEVSEHLVSFSTIDLEIEPMTSRRGQYVQVGATEGKVVWLAGVAAVVRSSPSDRGRVFFLGQVERHASGRRVVFQGGTVLRLGAAVDRPAVGSSVIAQIDPTRREVVEVLSR